LLSFDPCRFDCPAAAALAGPIAAIVADEEPQLWQQMQAVLARPIAMDRFDRRAWVEFDDRGDDGGGDGLIRVATPIRTIHGEPADPGLAELLPGQRVDAEGRVPGLGFPLRVLRFAPMRSLPN